MESDQELLKLCLERGIFFPSSEIFGDNLSGFWDYGPIGLKIFNNVLAEWRATLNEIDALEISGSVILPRKVLKASGHEKNFYDVVVTCRKCESVYRVDKLLEEKDKERNFEGLKDEEYVKLLEDYKIRCAKCGEKLEDIKKYKLMFGVTAGSSDEVNAYLRPEACQSIFLDFRRVFELYGSRLPMAIAQVGKAFRNELSPRNNLIRQREFYQNDIEIFFINDDDFVLDSNNDIEIPIADRKTAMFAPIRLSDALNKKIIEKKVTAYSLSLIYRLLERLGIPKDSIRFRKLDEEKAFYAKEAFDLEIKKGSEWIEVAACNHRGDYDLSAYAAEGAETLKVDGKIPNIFELSMGTDRLFYLLLSQSLMFDGERRLLKLNYRLSPFMAAVFPLLSKEELESVAQNLKKTSSFRTHLFYSTIGSIGKRYRRVDELGVPLAFTIDYQTLEDRTVTVRDRDTMSQFRLKVDDVDKLLLDSRSTPFSELDKKYKAH